MAFIETDEIYELYEQSKLESNQWRKDYHEFERLADNELIENLDESLPEVNDGSLAASLFRLPKRIINSKLQGQAKATDTDEAWVTELANIVWEEDIIPNANSQAPFIRKWKDAVRKAAIYGSVPIINLFLERGSYTGSDMIIAQPQDVLLEPGKVSDYDSDILFWDVYFSKTQVKSMIERAIKEQAQSKKDNADGYNKWDIPALKQILKECDKEERDSGDDHRQKDGKSVKRTGIKFCVSQQRGVDAPFHMFHPSTKKWVREWSNPDPTGDVQIHFLYCYQDFVNPYGIGIVKLAGGTQNVLDYMRQADVLATQIGARPPILIEGDADGVDLESLVYAQDAQWFAGNAKITRMEISNQVYAQLPNRISMYKTSLNQLIPVGDTSISQGSGDPQYSKTPAGVKFQQGQLSIDDEDFKDNTYMTYEAVARSMINVHFFNMQGTDLLNLSDENREVLMNAGLQFPMGEDGKPSTNELEVIWDNARAKFDWQIDAEQDKTQDDEKRLEGLLKVAQFKSSDPMIDQELAASGKKLNVGELYADIISLTSNNDKIIEDIKPEDQNQVDENGQPIQGGMSPQEQAPPPPPPKTIADSIRWTPADLTPAERAQVLSQGGIQPDEQGVTPSAKDQAMKHTIEMSKVAHDQATNVQNMSQDQGQEQGVPSIEEIVKQYGLSPQETQAIEQGLQQGFSIQDLLGGVQRMRGQNG